MKKNKWAIGVLACAVMATGLSVAKADDAGASDGKSCIYAGMSANVSDDVKCPGTVAEVLRNLTIEKQRPVVDEKTGAYLVDEATGEIMTETYSLTYRLMAQYAMKGGLAEVLTGGSVPQLHRGQDENGIVTVFAISDDTLKPIVDARLAEARERAGADISAKDVENILYQVIGSEIATRPYFKKDMWNGQRDFKSLGGNLIKTNFLTETGDEANGFKFADYNVLASNGVIHPLN